MSSQSNSSGIDNALEEGQWDGNFLQCCGKKCDRRGWAVCCGAYWCPCILFGHNSSKVLNHTWWIQSLLYWTVFSMIPGFVYGPVFVKRLEWNKWLFDCEVNYNLKRPVDQDCKAAMEVVESGGHLSPPGGDYPWQFWFVIGWSALAVAYVAYHRVQIRKRLNIRGGSFGDYCQWFWCSCCTLAQETRTVLKFEEKLKNAYNLEGLESALVEEQDMLLAQADVHTPPQVPLLSKV